jgi:hypothetical protein
MRQGMGPNMPLRGAPAISGDIHRSAVHPATLPMGSAGCPSQPRYTEDTSSRCKKPLGPECASLWPACAHTITDTRPIARCLRYGRLAPINSATTPAVKRPTAIHLGCMANLEASPLTCGISLAPVPYYIKSIGARLAAQTSLQSLLPLRRLFMSGHSKVRYAAVPHCGGLLCTSNGSRTKCRHPAGHIKSSALCR